MIRNSIRLGLTAAAATAASLAPAAAAQAGQHCHPHGSHGIVANNYARVWAKGAGAFVCIKSPGKTTKLQGANPAHQFAVGGKWSAGARISRWTRPTPASAFRTPPWR